MYTDRTHFMAMACRNQGSSDLYAILEVKKTASVDEIRKSYQRLAKQCHPDKLPPSLSEEEKATAIEQFHQVKRAYEILSDIEQRKFYDTKSNDQLLTQKWPISATLDLDEMTYDPETSSYSTPCRCSGCYVITEGEMEGGVDTINCSSCTLSIRILYQEANDEDQ